MPKRKTRSCLVLPAPAGARLYEHLKCERRKVASTEGGWVAEKRREGGKGRGERGKGDGGEEEGKGAALEGRKREAEWKSSGRAAHVLTPARTCLTRAVE